MKKEKILEIIKMAVGVVIIYMIAVLLSLCLCERFNDLESSEDRVIQNGSIVLGIR